MASMMARPLSIVRVMPSIIMMLNGFVIGEVEEYPQDSFVLERNQGDRIPIRAGQRCIEPWHRTDFCLFPVHKRWCEGTGSEKPRVSFQFHIVRSDKMFFGSEQ